MAPRRQKKAGLMRIDAAIDALRPCGFPEETIRRTINKLLKVYDDDAAWHVIEEGTYRLVIETILEEQEQEAREKERARKETKAPEVSRQVAEADEAGLDVNHGPGQDANGQGQPTLAAKAAEPHSDLGSGSHQSLTNQLTSPRPRRLPCYGWISEDEDETLDHEQERAHRVRKRSSGWDVKPSDM